MKQSFLTITGHLTTVPDLAQAAPYLKEYGAFLQLAVVERRPEQTQAVPASPRRMVDLRQANLQYADLAQIRQNSAVQQRESVMQNLASSFLSCIQSIPTTGNNGANPTASLAS